MNKAYQVLELLGQIDEQFIEEASDLVMFTSKQLKTRMAMKAGGAVGVLVLMLYLAWRYAGQALPLVAKVVKRAG